MTLQQNRVRPITLLFEVGFRKYITEMITILRRCVARNIWVATLNVKITAWPCMKIVSGPYLCYLKSDFENISQKWSLYWDDVSRATFGLLPWRSRSQHDLPSKCVRPRTLLFKSYLQLVLTSSFSVSNTYSGSITRFRPALVYFALAFGLGHLFYFDEADRNRRSIVRDRTLEWILILKSYSFN